MKVQEVILRAMAKRMTWWQAAEVIGISDRQMRRWRRRYEKFGYDGLWDRRCRRPSPRRVPLVGERLSAAGGPGAGAHLCSAARAGGQSGQHRGDRPSGAADRTDALAEHSGRVTVYEHLDGALSVGYGPHCVGRFNAQGVPLLEPLPRKRRPKAVEKTVAAPSWKTLRVSHFSTATATTGSQS